MSILVGAHVVKRVEYLIDYKDRARSLCLPLPDFLAPSILVWSYDQVLSFSKPRKFHSSNQDHVSVHLLRVTVNGEVVTLSVVEILEERFPAIRHDVAGLFAPVLLDSLLCRK